ncbi:MAG: DNA topoisomerase IB [Taibaiella sp.]|nr:DNA topoisomerase IB [Taibaiella sp.]
MGQTAGIKINKRQLSSLVNNATKSAEAANLVYVSDTDAGISRHKKADKFYYKFSGKTINDAETLQRIKSLVLPPAWEQVWICTLSNGHLQATGFDKKNRKQYKYHPLWNALRNQTKFHHLHDFGKALPAIRSQLQKDLLQPDLSLKRVLATIVSVMECTCIRIGNSMYEKLYGSFGLTTLKDQHVKIEGSQVKFSFKGKKGVYHDITLKNKKLANAIKQCRDIPGKELFQFYDKEGKRHSVDSGMVNNYIKEISGGNFTAKDFRTWAGSLRALEAFKEMEFAETTTAIKKNIVAVLDIVASHLGNTRTVCKKYYVHPVVIDHYTNNTMNKYLKNTAATQCSDRTDISIEEKVLMHMLEDAVTVVVAA